MNSDENNSFSGMDSNGYSGMNNGAGIDMSGLSGLNGYSDSGATMADSFAAAQDNLTAAGLASGAPSNAIGLDQIAETDPERRWSDTTEDNRPLEPAPPVPGSIGSVTSVPPLSEDRYAPDLDLPDSPSPYLNTDNDYNNSYNAASASNQTYGSSASYAGAAAPFASSSSQNYANSTSTSSPNYGAANNFASTTATPAASNSTSALTNNSMTATPSSPSATSGANGTASAGTTGGFAIGVPPTDDTTSTAAKSATATGSNDPISSSTLPASSRQSAVYGAGLRTPVVEAGNNMPIMSGARSSSSSSPTLNTTPTTTASSTATTPSFGTMSAQTASPSSTGAMGLGVPSSINMSTPASNNANSAATAAASPSPAPAPAATPASTPTADAFAAPQTSGDPSKLPFMPVGNFTDPTALPPTAAEPPKKMPQVSLGQSLKAKNPKTLMIILLVVIGLLVTALAIFIVLFIQSSNKEPGVVVVPPSIENTEGEDVSSGEVSESVQTLSCSRELDPDTLRNAWYEANSGSANMSANYVGDRLNGIRQTVNLAYNSNEMAEIAKTEIEIDRSSFLEQIASVEPFERNYNVNDNLLEVSTIANDVSLIDAANASTFGLSVEGDQVSTNLAAVQGAYEANGYSCMIE